MKFARPTNIDEALALLAAEDWDILSGGTDYYPALRDEPPSSPILDISAVSALKGITREPGGWRIGALTTWTDIVREDLPPAFDALKWAAREVGSVQIQNRATVAGNLCNASPAADGVPPLLVMDASIELSCSQGQRTIPLSEFILGNRDTALSADELVTAILIPDRGASGQSAFLKLGARKYLVISIVMVATRLSVKAGRIVDVAVAVGACSAVATRLPALEAALMGGLASEAPNAVTAELVNELAPISDVRASDVYREEAAVELVRRALRQAVTA